MLKFIEFSSLYELQAAFPTEESCMKFFEKIRWGGNVVSPFDENSVVYKCGNGKYKCSATNRYFTAITGSIFHGTKVPLRKWIMACYLMGVNKKGISSVQLSKTISVTQYTAWRMQQKIRTAMGITGYTPMLMGVVECDESYVGGKFKSRRRHHYKKEMGKEVSPVINKAVVFGMIERGGRVIMKHIPSNRREYILPQIEKHIIPGSTLMTDEYFVYKGLKGFQHDTVNHSAHEYVSGKKHTNTIENVWSTFKRGLYGTHHWVSRKHLQKYIDEFQFRFNRRKECDYNNVVALLKSGITTDPLKRKILMN